MNNRLRDRINRLVPDWRERRRGPSRPANDDIPPAGNDEMAEVPSVEQPNQQDDNESKHSP